MAKDLVYTMEVNEATATEKSEYLEQTDYFCSPSCQKAFDENSGAHVGGDIMYAGK